MSSVYQQLASYANDEREALCVLGERSMTYRALFTAVTEVGDVLARCGLGLGDRVALALPSTACSAVALLGVVSHATAAPLNPGYREREFDFYMSDVNAKAIILPAQAGGAARTVAIARSIPIIELIERPHWSAGQFELSSSVHERRLSTLRTADADDIALVLHTSGTTGRSKIVPLSHARLCITANNIRNSLRLRDSDRCLQCMPLFHVHGILNAVLASVTAGATVLCMPGFDPRLFWEWYGSLRPTWYTAVPTIHQSVLAAAESQRVPTTAAQLRFVRSSSAPLAPSVAARLEALFQAPVIESYGMTEVDQIATNPLPPQRRKPGSVGLPGGPEVAIIDATGMALPCNEVGEVAVRGPNVMAGYDGDPEANVAAFVNGYFRTGDLGYLDEDGYLFLAGRSKEIINRGGEKVAPREIDEVLLEHPAVQEAAAFSVPDSLLGEDVAAAVVLRADKNVSPTELRAFVAARLAGYKVPRTVQFLSELPKGPTGKLRRAELSRQFVPVPIDTRDSRDDLQNLQMKLEDFLTRLIKYVQPNVDICSSSENFVVFGLESMDITGTAVEISRALRVKLSLSLLYEYPSMNALSAHLLEAHRSRCEHMLASWQNAVTYPQVPLD